MARSKRRRPPVRPARPSSTKSLGHTAGRSRDRSELLSFPDIGEAFYRPVRSPLIRTVRIDSYPLAPRGGKRSSPMVQVRATNRSSDRQTRSPFLNATLVTPQLTERAIVCAKRGIRREVLFAHRQTGKGARSPKRKLSKVRC